MRLDEGTDLLNFPGIHSHHQEDFMASKNKDHNPAHAKTTPLKTDDVARQKQKAEQKEVAGRHKNDGQKDHKGRR